jgi:hypothetical protein
MNTIHKEERFVIIIQSQGSNQTNMQSTNYTAAKARKELNQSNRNSNTKRDGIQHTEAKIRRVLTVQKKRKSNAWSAC